MFNTSQNNKIVEVLSGPERRRRRTPQEKIAIIQQTMEPGMTVSHVARLHGINANLSYPRNVDVSTLVLVPRIF